jgi:hypothetical protein
VRRNQNEPGSHFNTSIAARLDSRAALLNPRKIGMSDTAAVMTGAMPTEKIAADSNELLKFVRIFGWHLLHKVPSPSNSRYFQFLFVRKPQEMCGKD